MTAGWGYRRYSVPSTSPTANGAAVRPKRGMIAPKSPAKFRPQVNRDVGNVWAGQELAEAQRLREFRFTHPVSFIDDHAARPHEHATDAAEPDLGEFKKQCSSRSVL